MFRIGINVGDVVVEGDDLLGDGVNIAARLEALAEPGGICIADAVQKQLAGKTDFAFEDTGERTLKNIAQPVRVWRWAKEPTPAAAGAPLPLPDRPSIAVLPFDNLSGQPEETYFSDGITEDIITGLARFRSLFVIARNSSFAFRGKPIEHGRNRPAAWRLLPSRRQRAAGRRTRAHHRAADRGGDRRASLGRTLRPQVSTTSSQCRTKLRRPSCRRWSGESRMQGFSNRSESRQPAWLPTTACCAAWPTFRCEAEDANQQAFEMFEKAVALDARYAVAHSFVHWCGWRCTVTPLHPPRCWTRRSPRQGTRSNSTRRRAAATEYYRRSVSTAASTTWRSNISGGHSTSTPTMQTI